MEKNVFLSREKETFKFNDFFSLFKSNIKLEELESIQKDINLEIKERKGAICEMIPGINLTFILHSIHKIFSFFHFLFLKFFLTLT